VKNLYEIDVSIEGISPLMMNRFSEETAEDVVKRVTGKPVSPEIALSLYVLPDGTIYQPATHIEGAFIKAAANFKITGKGKKTYKDLAKSSIFVEPDAIAHEIQEYGIDKRPVVNPTTRGRVIRARPILNSWKLSFKVKVLDDQFPKEAVKAILDYAGSSVGIGDYRPRYGRFIVTKFSITDGGNGDKEKKIKKVTK
jgi:hypothetical protein